MSPSHLARPSDHGMDRLLGDIEAIENAPTTEAAVEILDRRDQIFTELVKLRREQARTRRLQLLTRRRLNRKVTALKAEQDAL